MLIENAAVVGATRTWLERAVIGLRLCPFAEAPLRASRIAFHVSNAVSDAELLTDLRGELQWLSETNSFDCETSLLIHPNALTNFLEYNDFLEVCDAAVEEMELEGVLQVASFHPQYQFADSAPDSIENYTNRSPFPMLHVLREDSIENALKTVPEPEEIYRKNIRTMSRLGLEGWQKLWSK